MLDDQSFYSAGSAKNNLEIITRQLVHILILDKLDSCLLYTSKSFGDLVLFENISFGIAEGQRVGLIATHGTGKTTLLNVIAGKEGYDNGKIVFRRDLRVDYLEQDPQYPEELTVLEACFHHGNSTVELIKEYERCMETDGHPGLDELLVRMDQEEAWDCLLYTSMAA